MSDALTSNQQVKRYWFSLHNEEDGPIKTDDPHHGYESREEFVSARDYDRLLARSPSETNG